MDFCYRELQLFLACTHSFFSIYFFIQYPRIELGNMRLPKTPFMDARQDKWAYHNRQLPKWDTDSNHIRFHLKTKCR